MKLNETQVKEKPVCELLFKFKYNYLNVPFTLKKNRKYYFFCSHSLREDWIKSIIFLVFSFTTA